MDLATLYQARDYFKKKTHAPGALKLGVNPAILGDARFKGLATSAAELPKGILGVDVSMFTMSVTLRYDETLIPHALLDELFTTADPERGKSVLAELDQRLGLGLA